MNIIQDTPSPQPQQTSGANRPLYSKITGNILGYYQPPITSRILVSKPFLRADLKNIIALPDDFILTASGEFWKLLSFHEKDEITALQDKIREGMVNGSSFEGSPGTLVGIILSHPRRQKEDMDAFIGRTGFNPITELAIIRWFLQICFGDTPKNSFFADSVDDWCRYALKNHSFLAHRHRN